MYSLTLNFNTKEELITHLQGEKTTAAGKPAPLTLSPVEAEESEIVSVKDLNARDAAKAVQTITDENVLRAIYAEESRATVKKEIEKMIPIEAEEAQEIEAPPATKTSPGQEAFNRDACLKKIVTKIDGFQKGGMDASSLTNFVSNIFGQLGLSPMKIGQLDDSALISFSMAFNEEAKKIEAQQAAPTSTSFV